MWSSVVLHDEADNEAVLMKTVSRNPRKSITNAQNNSAIRAIYSTGKHYNSSINPCWTIGDKRDEVIV